MHSQPPVGGGGVDGGIPSQNVKKICLKYQPRGYFHIGRSGGEGLDLTSSLEPKFGARPGQVHQIRGKTWEVLLSQDTKVGKKSQFCSHI